MKKKLFWLIPLLILALALSYVLDYSHAAGDALAAMESDSLVTVSERDFGWLFDGPGEENLMIFYPGGKVEAQSYAPLLHTLAQQGLDCALAEMPLRFAFLGIRRADRVMEALSYKSFYLGGHSLGGAMAAVYAADHPELRGLVLLAAYPTKDLPENIKVLSLFGSRDYVVSREKITQGRDFIPGSYTELEILGGNHAQFGSYGLQKGDGEAQISALEQQQITVSQILDFIQ